MSTYVNSGYFSPETYISTDIYVDWGSYTIYVNKSDMIKIQSTPVEVYQLDMDVFRKRLKDVEDDVDGMPFPNTHNHYQPVTVSGASLARVVEILPPYTVTFEDGRYRVLVVGANTNIGERANVNQVSISTSNSAGLQDLNSLQAASFNGGRVSLDVNSPYSGTTFPIGIRATPVNNIQDAIVIAKSRGMSEIQVLSSMTLSEGDFSSGFTFVGDNPSSVLVTLESGANVDRCTFTNMTIQGVLDNNNIIRECSVLDIFHINGFIYKCSIAGTVTLGGNSQATILDCFSGIPGGGLTQSTCLDMGNSGNNLVLRNFSGSVTIKNCSGDSTNSIDMASGRVIFDSTCTGGDFTVRGVGEVIDNSNGAIINDRTLNGEQITKTLLNTDISEEYDSASVGGIIKKIKSIFNILIS